ncbi:hypothetical protein HK103_006042 [Boothiomyces macroporosus]|uniref:Carbohydrate kinase PfkB domain-containing protein n=1 Tax=Boothiomyces macroporosus TaxID=261099 RepID=A0AAD5UE98_9FUNG|nr:hypothetical protein HK103_006042 [Boothiomyces macroporosus]
MSLRKTPKTPVPITSSREILVVGLNPAFQSTLHLDNFRPGHVNRAARKCNSIGGKGQNFAIACSQYGETDKITVLQMTGGMTGSYIVSYLDELSIEHITIPISKTTRTCTTVLDKKTGSMTELIEPAGRIEIKERQILEETIKKIVPNSKRLEGIALCGTLPPGLSGSTYSLIAQLKPDDCVVLLDAYQNIECLNTRKVNILKINSEESRKLVGAHEDMDLVDVAKTILQQYQLRILAITDGPSTAYLFEQGAQTKMHTYDIPSLESVIQDYDFSNSPLSSSITSSLPEATGEAFQSRVGSHQNLASMGDSQDLLLNPLGAGDTCSAIFLLEYLDTKNASLAYQHGLAAASASCLMIDNTSHFDKRIKELIFDQITMETSIL